MSWSVIVLFVLFFWSCACNAVLASDLKRARRRIEQLEDLWKDLPE